MHPRGASAALLLVVASAAACGQMDAEEQPAAQAPCAEELHAAGCCPPFDYSLWTRGPLPSFRDDVMPIFTQGCAFSDCHDERRPKSGLFLGRKPDQEPLNDDELRDVWHGLRVAAVAAPAMKLVEPGDPERSFLMRSLDGDQNCLGLECTFPVGQLNPDALACGDPQPRGYERRPSEEREVIRSYIAWGAPLECGSDAECSSGRSCCDGLCDDLDSSEWSCGACGAACTDFAPVCTDGVCS